MKQLGLLVASSLSLTIRSCSFMTFWVSAACMHAPRCTLYYTLSFRGTIDTAASTHISVSGNYSPTRREHCSPIELHRENARKNIVNLVITRSSAFSFSAKVTSTDFILLFFILKSNVRSINSGRVEELFFHGSDV